MKTVGELLRSEREKQKKTLDQIAEKTKIRPSMLEHLERGEYQYLPSRTYVQGFVRAYAQALKLDADKALAFFRREYDTQNLDDRPLPKPLDRTRFVITPAKIFTVLGILVLLLFFGLLFWQFRQFAGKPVLIVDYPPNQITVNRPFVNVSGRTDPDVVVTVNGEQIPVSQDGAFQITIDLVEGLNTLTITGVNRAGKETTVVRDVLVNNADTEN